jgi:hypothetical protein
MTKRHDLVFRNLGTKAIKIVDYYSNILEIKLVSYFFHGLYSKFSIDNHNFYNFNEKIDQGKCSQYNSLKILLVFHIFILTPKLALSQNFPTKSIFYPQITFGNPTRKESQSAVS